MNKIVILAIAVCVSLGASAQFNQGRMLVGGSLGFNANTYKTKTGSTTFTTNKELSFSLAPQFGYFVINKLAVGAGVELGFTTYKSASSDYENTTTSIQYLPFARYYLQPGIFFQGQFGIGSEKYNNIYSIQPSTHTYGVTSWAGSVGYAWFLNDNVAIEPIVGYGSTSSKEKDSTPKSNITSGLFIKIGFQIYLGKK